MSEHGGRVFETSGWLSPLQTLEGLFSTPTQGLLFFGGAPPLLNLDAGLLSDRSALLSLTVIAPPRYVIDQARQLLVTLRRYLEWLWFPGAIPIDRGRA